MFSGLICKRPSNFLDHDQQFEASQQTFGPSCFVRALDKNDHDQARKYRWIFFSPPACPEACPIPLKKKSQPVFSGLICMRPSNFLDHDGVGRMAHGPTAGVHSIHLGNFFVHLGNFVSFTSLDRARST